ncbi:transcription initiation factor TFIID subunit 5-like [Drosophila obscura]|uniref:transcription initiation factor TFIID subunit 5-like n=1 Tax=Drosophila obscura TaxID=7282 RepID=UPI001BB1DF52|nr:transcription initiation factor TFIID subunit 5-like [Drosophila obscura]
MVMKMEKVGERSELYEDYMDFYEGGARGASLQRKLCKAVSAKVLTDYERMVEAIGSVTEHIFEFRKYEVYVMLYPTLAMGYLQMVWSGKGQRAKAFVERHRHDLDDSYRSRMARLVLIRRPEEVPGRAVELLAGADKVQFFMACSTFQRFKTLQAKFWTGGQLAVFLAHFDICIYADEKLSPERVRPARPLPEPFSWAAAGAVPDWPLDRSQLPRVCINMAAPMDSADEVTCATLSEDHCSVAFGTGCGMVHVVAVNKDWRDANNLRRENVFCGHQQAVLACAFSPGDRHLLTSSADCTMRLWCTRSGFCKNVYQYRAARCVVFGPRGCHFATSSDDNVARVWGVDSRSPLLSLYGHLARLEVCLFHPNGNYWATGSADATVRIWDYDNRAQVRLLRGHKAPVTALVYSVCGRYLVSGGRDNLIIVWDTADERMIRCLCQHKAMIASMEISCCNNLLAVWSRGCQLSLWDFQLLLKQSVAQGPAPLICSLKGTEMGIFLQGGFHGRNGLVAICTTSCQEVKELSAKAVQQEASLAALVKKIADIQAEIHLNAERKLLVQSMLEALRIEREP